MRYLCALAFVLGAASVGVDLLDARPSIAPELWEPSVSDYTVQVAATGNGRYASGGTAVSFENGKFYTAWHVVESQPYVHVKVNGQFLKAIKQRVGNKDLAILNVPETCEGSLERRVPVFGEKVTLRTLYSGQIQFGTVSDVQDTSFTVSTRVVDPGAVDGDSGSGVFGEDGALIGIVRAINPKEPRAIYVERTVDAPVAPQAAPPCAGGVCPIPRG